MVSSYPGSQRAGKRRGLRLLIALVVLIAVLIAADFTAKAVAENVAATAFQKQGKLSHKPSVSIEGFPFLTQVARKSFSDVLVSDSNLKEGPLTITSVHAKATGVKINSFSFSSGTIAHLSGTLLIDFASLGNTLTTEVGPLGAVLHGAGLNLSAAGPDEVKASINLIVTTGSATWRVTKLSPRELNIQLIKSSGLPPSLLSSIQSVNVHIPKLPLGLTIKRVRVTPAGVVGTVSGSDVPFGS